MPTILKTKNSVTTTVAPTTLQQGELAVNITDKKLWVGNAATTPVQLLGAGVTGDVVGPASATDNALARFDATTGKLIQNSVGILSDAGALTGITDFTYTGTLTGGTGIVNLGSGQFYKTSGGDVGIGASSPTTKLQVAGAIHLTGAGTFPATGEGIEIVPSVAGGDNYIQAYSRTASSYQKLIISSSQTALQTGGSTRLFLASNGNIGLSTTTPSNWTGGFFSMEYAGANGFYSQTTQASLSSNAYNNSGWKYAGTGTAGLFTNSQGDFVFYGADSGTTGNTISSLAQILQVKKDYTLALQGTSTVVGTGLTFPSTQNASANANTLDDYEEGTWSPTIVGWTGTYSQQLGTYTKIGRLVTLIGVVTTNAGTGTFSATFPTPANYPFVGSASGASSGIYGQWAVVSGATGLGTTILAAGPLDGPTGGGTSGFPNVYIAGSIVGNWNSAYLNAAVAVEYRFSATYYSS